MFWFYAFVAVGVLAGPAAWPPAGRLAPTTTLEPSGAPGKF